MSNNFQKFLFLGVIVALALFSRVAYPTFYAAGGGSAGDARAASFGERVPLFVLPSLSATVAQQVTSGKGQGTSDAQSSSSTKPSQAPEPAITSQIASGDSAAVAAMQSPTAVDSSVFTQTGNAPAPAIADRASLVADLQTGSVIYGMNVNRRWPLASLTKLMTATVVLDKLDLSQKVTVTPAAVAVDPNEATLQAGDVYVVADLLRVMLLPSSNVAAEALANAYGRPQFLAEMNARAAAWDMAGTHYDDPSGLSVGNQSTASDLLRLAQKIYADYPQILAITRTPQVTITELGSSRQASVKSINDFAGRSDFIGGKTGYTDEAAGNLLSIFKYKNQPVLIIVLGTDDGVRFAKTLQLYDWFTANFK
jgi:serine-type D-Ala-D-Ala endopeptidase (penicillin-binding protein 7)